MSASFARPMEAIWLTAAVAIPLALNPWGCNAFELPKTRLLQALALLVGVAALIHLGEVWGASGRTAPRRSFFPMLWPALAFGLIQVAATVFSVHPRLSLWGSYDRQQGLLTLGAYLALFWLVALGQDTRVRAERLLKALAWGSAPVVAYGLLQAAGLDPLPWHSDAASPILSTIGRANFLGSYLVLVLPPTAACLFLARRRWPYTGLLVGQLTCLALAQARGAWVGGLVAAVAGVLAWALAVRSRKLALTTAALTIVAVGLLVLLIWPGGPLASLARLPGLDRLAALSRTDAGSTAARLTIWRATLPLISARPWLGYGPETMRQTFVTVFPPQLVYYQGRHTVVDRAHNLWLDLAASAGVGSVVAFGALVAGCGYLAWRGLRCASDSWERIVWAALASAIAGHMADLQFGFDLTASATVFWLLLGMAAAMGRGLSISPSGQNILADDLAGPDAVGRAPKRLRSTGRSVLPYLLPTLAALALVGVLCARPLLADVACGQAQRGDRSLEERLAAGQRAVRLWLLEPAYRLELAWLYMEAGDPTAAEGQQAAAVRLVPGDASVWAARGAFYALWGEREAAHYLQAEEAYRTAVALAPNVAAYHASLGALLARQGRLEEGVAELERAVELDATDGAAYYYLAGLYRTLGRDAEAERAWREALRWGGGEEAGMND